MIEATDTTDIEDRELEQLAVMVSEFRDCARENFRDEALCAQLDGACDALRNAVGQVVVQRRRAMVRHLRARGAVDEITAMHERHRATERAAEDDE